jgi:hypothetical protein
MLVEFLWFKLLVSPAVKREFLNKKHRRHRREYNNIVLDTEEKRLSFLA